MENFMLCKFYHNQKNPKEQAVAHISMLYKGKEGKASKHQESGCFWGVGFWWQEERRKLLPFIINPIDDLSVYNLIMHSFVCITQIKYIEQQKMKYKSSDLECMYSRHDLLVDWI